MAKSVSNADIEDVLSSIRRLVSTEDREQRKEDERADEEDADEKLVLSPAQRIDSQDQSSDEPSDHEEMAQPAEVTGEDGQDVPDEPQEPEEAEAQETEHAQEDDDSAGHEEAPAILEETAMSEPQAGVPDGPDEFGLLDDVLPDNDDRNELERRIAGVEAAVAATEDEWEPDGVSDDAFSGVPVSALPWDEDTGGADAAEAREEAEIRAEGELPDEQAEDRKDEPHTNETHADETHDDDPQEDASGMADAHVDDPAEEVAEIANVITAEADPAESEPVTDEADEGDEDGAEDASVPWYTEDAVIDEEALRDIVSEIVRQELQGALGERITRNVRKLVRREIQRALTAQKLD